MKETNITDGENKKIILTDEQLANIILSVSADSFGSGCQWGMFEAYRENGETNKYLGLTEYLKNLNTERYIKQFIK